MNRRAYFSKIGTIFGPAMLALFLSLFFTGCGGGANPQDGDPDAKLGIYNVDILPSPTVTITNDPTVGAVSVTVQLRARCEGLNLDPDCDKNIPNWQVKLPDGTAGFIKVQIADPASPDTTAVVSLDTAKYTAYYGNNLSSISYHWYTIGLLPSSLPPKTRLRRDHLFLTVAESVASPRREEQTPNQPRLSIVPKPYSRFISTLIYTGPDTEIADIIYSGSGAKKFVVVSPARSTRLSGGTHTLPLQIDLVTDAGDFAVYSAVITIVTLNGASASVAVSRKAGDP